MIRWQMWYKVMRLLFYTVRITFYEELLGLRFKISQFSFFQTNTLGAEVLYRRQHGTSFGDISGAESGTRPYLTFTAARGTIAQILAPVAKKVIGVELVEEAVLAARQNAKLNGLENCEFIAGDVLKVLDELEDKPDFIVLDPAARRDSSQGIKEDY